MRPSYWASSRRRRSKHASSAMWLDAPTPACSRSPAGTPTRSSPCGGTGGIGRRSLRRTAQRQQNPRRARARACSPCRGRLPTRGRIGNGVDPQAPDNSSHGLGREPCPPCESIALGRRRRIAEGLLLPAALLNTLQGTVLGLPAVWHLLRENVAATGSAASRELGKGACASGSRRHRMAGGS